MSLSTNTKRPASGSRSGAVQSWEGHWPPLAYWVKVVAIVVATFWIMMGIKAVAEVLLLVAVSLVLAVGMDPLIVWLSAKAGISRGRVVLVLAAAFGAIVILFLVLVVPAAIRQLGNLSNDLPAYLARVQVGRRLGGQLPSSGRRRSRRPRPSWKGCPIVWAAPSGRSSGSRAGWERPSSASRRSSS